jgi:hypothetical protein
MECDLRLDYFSGRSSLGNRDAYHTSGPSPNTSKRWRGQVSLKCARRIRSRADRRVAIWILMTKYKELGQIMDAFLLEHTSSD